MGGRVTVIGGGISGLSLAYWLTREGLDVTLLEKEDRAGGCIRSENQEGYLVDYAANCLLNFLPEVDDLCDGVGLSSQKVFRRQEAKFRYLLKEGKLLPVPSGPAQFAGTRLWSFKGKMRLFSEPFIPTVHGKNGEDGKEESVAQFIKRRLGEEFLDYAVEPFVSGNYAGDVDRLCIRSTFPRLFDLERRYGSLTLGAVIQRLRGSKTNCQRRLFSFKDGMGALPGAISRFLGNRFRKGYQVVGLEPRNRGWEVTAIGGPTKEVQRFTSEVVVLSTPADSASGLAGSFSGTLKGLLAGIEYSPIVVLYLGFARRQVRHPLDGMGYLVPRKEEGFVLGSLWSSSLFSHRAPSGKVALTNYLGGSRWPNTLGMSDGALLNKTLTDLSGVLGIVGDPEMVRIIRHSTGIPQYSLGHQDRLRKIDESLQKLPGLFLTGNYLRGISVRDCISQGMRVSGQVLEYLKSQKS